MNFRPLTFSYDGYSCLVSGSYAAQYWDALRNLDTTMAYLALDCNVGQFGYIKCRRLDDNYLRC